MRKIALTTIMILSMSACSFKKNNQHYVEQAPSTPAEKIEQLIFQGDESHALENIEHLSRDQVRTMNATGNYLNLALKRGNSAILIALLKKGISPYAGLPANQSYTFDKSFDRNAFVIMSMYNSEVMGQLEVAIQINQFSYFKEIVDTLGISCTSLMDLYQEFHLESFSAFPNKDAQFISFLKNLPECHLESSSHINDWITKEILKIYTNNETLRNPQLFLYLLSINRGQKLEFKSDLIPNIERIDPKVVINYKIDQIDSIDEKTSLRLSWLAPLTARTNFVELDAGLDENYQYYIGPNKANSQSEIDTFMSSQVLKYLNTQSIAHRSSCFVSCTTNENYPKLDGSLVDFLINYTPAK